MNIAQTATEATETKSTTISFYVNMEFSILAESINNEKLIPQFDGKGRKIVYIPQDQESTYLYYSSDQAWLDKIEPPFVLDNGDTVNCKLQAAPTDKSKVKYKWKGILQNRFDLQLVSGTKSNAEATYKAVTDAPVSETDEVIIHINFKLNGDKFSAAWDPRVRVRGNG